VRELIRRVALIEPLHNVAPTVRPLSDVVYIMRAGHRLNVTREQVADVLGVRRPPGGK
jgi:hypothetical protein